MLLNITCQYAKKLGAILQVILTIRIFHYNNDDDL